MKYTKKAAWGILIISVIMICFGAYQKLSSHDQDIPGKFASLHIAAGLTPPTNKDAVVQLLGQPTHIEQSETTGITGEVYYYTTTRGEGRVTFLNNDLFKAEFIPGDKKS